MSENDAFDLLPLDQRQFVDGVCAEFERGWRAKHPFTLETFVAKRIPPESPPVVRAVLINELLLLDLDYRQRYGESPREEEYSRRLPNHLDLVREAFSVHRGHVSRITPPSKEAPALNPLVPTIPSHEIVGQLGAGGMGVVYKARQRQSDQWVAIKMFRPYAICDRNARARFYREMNVVARLRHPHIVSLLSMGECPAGPYFTLEYLSGGNLAEEIRRGPMAIERAAEIAEQVARGLDYAHRQKILHRDLSPSNVLLTDNGIAKIGDFGLARLMEAATQLTPSDTVVGTPKYMAPEQAAGVANLGPGVDIYSLGAILYLMLTGQPPFEAASIKEMFERLTRESPVRPRQLRPEIPEALEAICLRCLEKQPENRYLRAMDLAHDLQLFQRGALMTPSRVAPAPRFFWGGSHNSLKMLTFAIWGAIGLVIVSVILGFLYWIAASQGWAFLPHGLDKNSWRANGEKSAARTAPLDSSTRQEFASTTQPEFAEPNPSPNAAKKNDRSRKL